MTHLSRLASTHRSRAFSAVGGFTPLALPSLLFPQRGVSVSLSESRLALSRRRARRRSVLRFGALVRPVEISTRPRNAEGRLCLLAEPASLRPSSLWSGCSVREGSAPAMLSVTPNDRLKLLTRGSEIHFETAQRTRGTTFGRHRCVRRRPLPREGIARSHGRRAKARKRDRRRRARGVNRVGDDEQHGGERFWCGVLCAVSLEARNRDGSSSSDRSPKTSRRGMSP